MPDRPADLGPMNLPDVFPPVSDAEWESVIRADLKGADYDKRLLWRTEEGVTVRPFYRSGDLSALATQIESHPGAFPFTRGSGRSPSFDSTAHVDGQTAVRADLLHDAGATTVQELGFALAEGVERMAALTDRGIPAGTAASSITFFFAVGSTLLLRNREASRRAPGLGAGGNSVWRAGSSDSPDASGRANRQDEQERVRPVHESAAGHDRGAFGVYRRV